ncbi:glycosyltransferase family 2 protein [Plantactinospora solaniradicis]|uniref:Glycosyltransferase family 2 protein n=1 Tax=Plantactinospora solaniradicis TaxID=1723736 RepID=A0ABW1KNK5_9ACTN
MRSAMTVTVIGATRNARVATRLTYASFRRHTPEPVRVLLADNGSVDGTLEDLRRLDWVTVWSLDERKRLAEADVARVRRGIRRLAAGLDSLAEELPDRQRSLLERVRTEIDVRVPSDEELCRHSTALDWLVTKVETPYFLLLDSDVEFLDTGWLTDLVDLAEREGLAAVGEYEPARFPVQPRLATYLLLLRTDVFRSLRVPFRSVLRFGDPDEERRWHARELDPVLDPSAFDGYGSAAFYDTAAVLFERIQQRELPWRSFPREIADKFHHLGHMSWAADAGHEYVGVELLHEHVRAANEHALHRLASCYGGGALG